MDGLSHNIRKVRKDIKRSGIGLFINPIAYSTDGIYLLKDGLGFSYIFNPLPYPTDDVFRAVRILFEGGVPEDSFLSVSLVASNRISHITNDMVNLRKTVEFKYGNKLKDTNIFREMFKELKEFYEEGTKKSLTKNIDFKVKDFYVILSVMKSFRGKGYSENFHNKLLDSQSSVYSLLKGIGIEPYKVDPLILLRTYYEIMYPNMPEEQMSFINWDKKEALCNQLYSNEYEIEIDKEYLRIGNSYIGSLSVKMYPEEFGFGDTLNYIGDMIDRNKSLPFNYMITLNTYIPNQEQELNRLTQDSVWITRQAFGAMERFVPQIRMKKENYDIMMEYIVKKSEWVNLSYLNFTVYGNSLEELKENMGKMESYYRTKHFILNKDKYINFELFMNNLPLNTDMDLIKDLHRYRTMSSSNSASLIPMSADWKGTKTPVLSFVSRRGQLMTLDLFDSQGGFSGCIFAKTGSGKSFLVNDIIMSYLSLDSQIWVIDAGKSYQKLCETLGGKFIEFKIDSDISLNPFSKIYDLSEEMVSLKSLIGSMAKPEGCDNYELSSIERIIKENYEIFGNDMKIDDLYDSLIREDNERIRLLGESLYPFTSRGIYGKYFNRPSTVDLSHPFIVLELDELKSHPHLQSIVLLVLMMVIQQEMYLGDRGRRKLMIVDEAWDLLNKGNVAEFMMGGYRRFRKYRGAALIITQSVNDLYQTSTGEAIAENSDFYFMLQQKNESIAALKKRGQLVFSEFEYDLLSSVYTDKGNYSEVFIYSSTNGKGIGRLIRNRYVQLLYTTDSRELSILNRIQKQGYNLDESIKIMIEMENKYKLEEIEMRVESIMEEMRC